MTGKLTFISAGAGSGKTHRLTGILHAELAAKRVNVAGVIATTFTRKAATELRERVREFLLEQGEHGLANAMGQARIGTVNAVCGELLRRFAFEAGLPTEQTVVEEEQAKLLLRHAIDAVQDSAATSALITLRYRLNVETKDWDQRFRDLVSAVRANAIDPAQLAAMAQANADELLAHFPKAVATDLNSELCRAIEQVRDTLLTGVEKTKATREYVELMDDVYAAIKSDEIVWSQWIKLSKAKPAKAFIPATEEITAIAARVPMHPQLQQDLRDYLQRKFELCAQVLEAYAQIKRERGVLDFTDQERLLLGLLDHPFVAETLRGELDLLMVDEFQDTSPIQLALFLKLAEFAKQVYWVGDIKQAIYGFRGSDTALMEAMLKSLPTLGGSKEQLSNSWRSRAPLVQLVNEAFVPAFASTMTEDEIQLAPKRTEPLTGAPYAHWLLPGRNKDDQIAALAASLKQLVASNYPIYDKPTKRIRPVNYGDIALLLRSNDNVTKTALQLRALGIPAMTSQPGLLATPEAVLALACLRRINDPGDTIASAEIISLADCSVPEEWVLHRLEYLAAGGSANEWREVGDDAHPILSTLRELRSDMPLMAPAETLETVITSCQVASLALRWTASVDVARVRLANLDALMALARQYETQCAGANHAASVSGLLLWFSELQREDSDNLALPAIDAVQVLTHHKSKGLEWPVVVLMDLHGKIKSSLWDSVRAQSGETIVATDPLRARSIRYWPWPFGKQEAPLEAEVDQSELGQAFIATATEEAKRVLYVSMTRARDLMIVALPEKSPTGPWLDAINAPWLIPEENLITLPSGVQIESLPLNTEELTAKPATGTLPSLWWYPASTERTPRLPRTFNPSAATSPAMRVAEAATIGERLTVASKTNMTTLGHAIHAVLALAFVDMGRPMTTEDCAAILAGYGIRDAVAADKLCAQVIANVAWVQARWPGCKAFPELPIESVLANGQILNGRIDLLVDAGDHWVLIDHKSNPGGASRRDELAQTYGGQLLAYADAIVAASGKPVRELWLTLPVSASAIRIETEQGG